MELNSQSTVAIIDPVIWLDKRFQNLEYCSHTGSWLVGCINTKDSSQKNQHKLAHNMWLTSAHFAVADILPENYILIQNQKKKYLKISSLAMYLEPKKIYQPNKVTVVEWQWVAER